MRNLLAILFCVLLLSSCAKSTLIGDKLSDKATEKQQEQVKQEVLKLLEQEYKQPFKIVDYSYDYGVHWKDKTCAIASLCPKVFYGVYRLKIETVKKPVLSLNVKIEDHYKNIMKRFEENYLPVFYCGALGSYFDSLRINHIKNTNKEYLAKAEELCNSRNQSIYYEKSKEEYLKSIK